MLPDKNRPLGKTTVPPCCLLASSIAAWIAFVFKVLPSPMAPTSSIEIIGSSINFESFKKTYENNNINCELFNFQRISSNYFGIFQLYLGIIELF